MLYYVLVSLYVVVCLLLLLVVLLQQGKGGDIASAFGGGGSTQAAFGARSAGTVLTRASTILGALFLHETITPLFLLGGVLIGVGLVISSTEK